MDRGSMRVLFLFGHFFLEYQKVFLFSPDLRETYHCVMKFGMLVRAFFMEALCYRYYWNLAT